MCVYVCVCVWALGFRFHEIPGELGAMVVGFSIYDWESRDDEMNFLFLKYILDDI